MSSKVRMDSINFEEFCKQIANLSNEELVRELYSKTLLCEENNEIMENLMDGIFISDGNGYTIQANAAYERLIGIDRKELIGLHLSEYKKRGYITESCALEAIEKKRPMTIESCFLKTNKKCLITCIPLLAADGSVSLTVANLRDLTELQSLKEEIDTKEKTVALYKQELEVIKNQMKEHGRIIAEDQSMILVLNSAKRIAPMESTVLLTGESGTGKEVVAQYVHDCSGRKGNFIRINCGAIADGLFESELFGYETGAFTGAKRDGKMGLIEAANKGTLFLDEIGEMPMNLQTKLLRVIQEREVTRVGGVKPVKVDVRIIAATNKNLLSMVKEKKFREDLYYRLNVVPIHIPPLRERKADVLPLAQHVLDRLNEKYGYNKRFSNDTVKSMMEYQWPGNVRELYNIVERSVILSETDILHYLAFPQTANRNMELQEEDKVLDLKEVMKRIEYDYMQKAYRKFNNVRQAAKSLGMSKSSFSVKYQAYKEQFAEE